MIQTDNKQPVKEISWQDIYQVYDVWEQLKSWQEVLPLLETFFEDETRPVNKQLIARKYYACSKVFASFYVDFNQLMEKMEAQLLDLRSRKKV